MTSLPDADRPTDAGSLDWPWAYGEGSLDVADQADQRRWVGRVDDPAASSGRRRRAVSGEPSLNVRPGRRWKTTVAPPSRNSHDSASAGRVWRLGVDRGQALEELRRDRGAADVALARPDRATRPRRHEDPDRVRSRRPGRAGRAGRQRRRGERQLDRRRPDATRTVTGRPGCGIRRDSERAIGVSGRRRRDQLEIATTRPP